VNTVEEFNERRRNNRIKQGKQKLNKMMKSRMSIMPEDQIKIDEEELMEVQSSPKDPELATMRI